MNQPARRPAGVVRQRRGGRHFAGAEFPVTSLRSRRLWTALVAVAMTLSMTFLPGAQVVQAKQKTPSPTVQAAPTPSSDAPVVEAVVAPSPSEETTVQAPDLDAAESPASDAPATEPVTEEPVLVTPTLVEPEASAEGERAPPVAALEPTTDAAPAALEPAVEPAPAEGGIVPMNGSGDPDVSYNVGCVVEHVDFGLNCTANDVSLAKATNIAPGFRVIGLG